ncbi:glycosyltransferase [Aestuariicella sp. G3-2]|uniref:glycosyltransferase n=1 Tax=Pseudomaricurvus albidus TaxID=2842452 RepID=UPI001C0D9D99|nr:glycosyltransferase [Aestuariicella albida]MBU3071673.1 glycosyltransferase [Aestuariicella albida]
MKKALFYIRSISGGAGKNFIFVANEMAQHGWFVEVNYCRGEQTYIDAIDSSVTKVRLKHENVFLVLLILFKKLLGRNFDAVFSTGIANNVLVILASFVSRFRGKVIVREALSLKAYKIKPPRLLFAFRMIYRLSSWLNKPHVINLNLAMEKDFEESGCGGEKLIRHVIGNPVSVQKIRYRSLKEYELPEWIKNRTCKIVAVGRLVKEKDFHKAIDVIRLLSKDISCGLLILGEGPLKEKLQEYIDDCGMHENIELLGFQENPYAVISACDLLLSTSKAEGQPNAILEALALSKPIVAYDCSTGPKEIVEKYSAGVLVESDEVNLYVDAIKTLLSNNFEILKESIALLENDYSESEIRDLYVRLFEGNA